MMKKIVALLVLLSGTLSISAQVKKPTLMILPSDNWCTQRYFTTTYQDIGGTVTVPDYQLAFRQDTELGGVISLVGQMLTDRGYSLKDSEQELKAMAMRAAEDNVTMSRTSGASLVESPLDVLKRRSKADIIIQIGWQVHKADGGKAVTFALEAFDSYTSKRIATATGTSEPSNDIVPAILETTVRQYIDAFDSQMDRYFAGLVQNGREIVLTVRCWDSWENDLETEYDGEELTDCIHDWLYDNTVNGSFNLTDGTESFLQFEQVRIPLADERGRAVDARAFATDLRKYLQEPPFEITSKVMMRGLGEAIIVLGEK